MQRSPRPECWQRGKRRLIRKVLVGPTPNPELSVEVLQALFHLGGHDDVEVENSRFLTDTGDEFGSEQHPL